MILSSYRSKGCRSVPNAHMAAALAIYRPRFLRFTPAAAPAIMILLPLRAPCLRDRRRLTAAPTAETDVDA